MLQIASLNSGSNGNCYYIGNDQEAVLIDAGISCRETERRMSRLGLLLGKVKAIFISHEHIDHIRGAEVLSRKHRIPIYITDRTYHHGRIRLEDDLRCHFSMQQPVKIGSLLIRSFPKWHDAAEPHSFTISGHGATVGVFTDIGTACEQLESHLAQCDAAFLESNYDEGMLDRGPYPLYLKRRIRGAEGHLSNIQALELFLTHGTEKLKLLILSHLSAENNHPKLVHDLFSKHCNGTRIEIASRYEESAVFQI
jgi:phosphoribosyl 1,2-cyclic phosphodiesterase